MFQIKHKKILFPLFLMCSLQAGCNVRPWTIRNPVDDDFEVDTADSAEIETVKEFEKAHIRYRESLVALQQYYQSTGDYQRRKWAENELHNLKRAHNVEWEGLGPIEPESPGIEGELKETEIVEIVIANRQNYLDSLDRLAMLLETKGNNHRTYVIKNILNRFHPEETYNYLMSAELPPENLKPSKVIPEANEMYDRALKLYRDGKMIPAAANYEKERRALMIFKRMIRSYPESTRIAHAAFYIGEIYKEYFREHYLAVQWYQRALAWNPDIPLPVRFQAAVQYDFNLSMKKKAIQYYRGAVRHEGSFDSNTQYALQRMDELQEHLSKEQPEK